MACRVVASRRHYSTRRSVHIYGPSHHGLGGAILLRLYLELMGLRGSLAPLLVSFAKTSKNQIPVSDVLLAWWYG